MSSSAKNAKKNHRPQRKEPLETLVAGRPLEGDADRRELGGGSECMPNCAMVDLETMGKKPGCIIISIGAVKFDPFKNQPMSEIMDQEIFYAMPSRFEQQEAGLVCDVGTAEWWVTQSDKAKEAFKKKQRPVEEVLDEFTAFMRGVSKIWCNGPSFDTPILREVYYKFQRTFPGQYWADLDCRTAKFLAGGSSAKVREIETLVAHDALQDSIKQATLVQRWIRMMPAALKSMFDDG